MGYSLVSLHFLTAVSIVLLGSSLTQMLPHPWGLYAILWLGIHAHYCFTNSMAFPHLTLLSLSPINNVSYVEKNL